MYWTKMSVLFSNKTYFARCPSLILNLQDTIVGLPHPPFWLGRVRNLTPGFMATCLLTKVCCQEAAAWNPLPSARLVGSKYGYASLETKYDTAAFPNVAQIKSPHTEGTHNVISESILWKRMGPVRVLELGEGAFWLGMMQAISEFGTWPVQDRWYTIYSSNLVMRRSSQALPLRVLAPPVSAGTSQCMGKLWAMPAAAAANRFV